MHYNEYGHLELGALATHVKIYIEIEVEFWSKEWKTNNKSCEIL